METKDEVSAQRVLKNDMVMAHKRNTHLMEAGYQLSWVNVIVASTHRMKHQMWEV